MAPMLPSAGGGGARDNPDTVLAIGFPIVILLWRHAEAERQCAEDELRLSGVLLSEIAAAGSSGTAQDFILTRDSVIAIFQKARNHILELRKHAPMT